MSLWLARIQPDQRRKEVRKDLRDIVSLHQTVMKLFPDGIGDQARRQASVLFRLDETPTGPYLLVQTRLDCPRVTAASSYGNCNHCWTHSGPG
jgi:CRISPR system Cascade subunit CasE